MLAEQARAAAAAEPSDEGCLGCGGSATYRGPDGAYCTACAQRYSNRESAHAWAALGILAVAAQAASDYSTLSRDELVAAVDDALEHMPDGLLREPKLPRWANGLFDMDSRYKPLGGESR